MRLRIVLAVGFAIAAWGCGFDAGNPLRTRPVATTDPTAAAGDGDETGETEESAAEGVRAGAESASPPGPGTGEGGQGAGPGGGATSGHFTAAYAARSGPSTRNAKHAFAGSVPVTNPAGRPCLGCHGAAGPAPRFAFGGTVYRDARGTMPAAQVEVRIVDPAGGAISVYTDADGNYFARAGAGAAFPALPAVRDADAQAAMKDAAGANCNACHRGGGAAGPLALP